MIMFRKHILLLITTTLTILCSVNAHASSPWVLEPGSKQVYMANIYETFDRFYRGGEDGQLPDDIDQSTVTVGLNYGMSDSLMLDIQTGYTQTQFTPASRGDFEGRDDSKIGITWRFIDEFISGPKTPTAALRVGYIWKGDYESSSPGNPHSPGDGASGFEGSVLLGKSFDSGWALSGELGLRDRESVPSEYFYNVSINKSFRKFSTSLAYLEDHAFSGKDIGDPGVTPSDFEKLEEIKRIVDFGMNYRLFGSMNIGLNYATVVGGRNTGKSDIYVLSTGYSF